MFIEIFDSVTRIIIQISSSLRPQFSLRNIIVLVEC